MVRIGLALALCFHVVQVSAAFWDADNFDECVLNKMKGQNEKMLGHARGACRRLFPKEVDITSHLELAKPKWSTTANRISVEVPNYFAEIMNTRFAALLTKGDCDAESFPKPEAISVEFKFSNKEGKSSLSLRNANEYNCFVPIGLWGIEIKED